MVLSVRRLLQDIPGQTIVFGPVMLHCSGEWERCRPHLSRTADEYSATHVVIDFRIL